MIGVLFPMRQKHSEKTVTAPSSRQQNTPVSGHIFPKRENVPERTGCSCPPRGFPPDIAVLRIRHIDN